MNDTTNDIEIIKFHKRPILWIQFWLKIHLISLRVCGKWFGIALRTDGTFEIRDETLQSFIEGTMRRK